MKRFIERRSRFAGHSPAATDAAPCGGHLGRDRVQFDLSGIAQHPASAPRPPRDLRYGHLDRLVAGPHPHAPTQHERDREAVRRIASVAPISRRAEFRSR